MGTGGDGARAGATSRAFIAAGGGAAGTGTGAATGWGRGAGGAIDLTGATSDPAGAGSCWEDRDSFEIAGSMPSASPDDDNASAPPINSVAIAAPTAHNFFLGTRRS